MDENNQNKPYSVPDTDIIRPTLLGIKKMYANAKVIKSIWGNTFDLKDHNLSKVYRLHGIDIFIPHKDNENKDICVYDYDMNRYAEIIE